MLKLEEIKNAGENLTTDAKLALAQQALLQAASLIGDKKVPLNANHQEYLEKQKEDEKKSLLKALALFAGSLGVLGILACRGKKFVDQKAREEKDRLELEKKEMIRRLSAIKGRQ